MKIEYELERSFQTLKELVKISLNKQFILKGKKIRINMPLILIVCSVLIVAVGYGLKSINCPVNLIENFADIGTTFILVLFCSNVFYYLIILSTLLSEKDNIKGEIKVNKESIADKTNGNTVTIDKDNIKGLIIGKHIMCIFYNSSIVVYLPRSIEKKLLKEIKDKGLDIPVFHY